MKIDLHTHSQLSYDGGLSFADYKQVLESKLVDYIAITDHNKIAFALNAAKKIGNQIIVGEEILTKEGEIIGLFLEKHIKPRQSLVDTIKEIKKQKGLVYIPHPSETWRHGLSLNTIKGYADSIDILELYNARTLGTIERDLLKKLALDSQLGLAASTDAHNVGAIGVCYSTIENSPSSRNLRKQLIDTNLVFGQASLIDRLSPFINKLKKRISPYV